MEKSTQAKRKAQKLARDGHVPQAIEEMRNLLGEGEVDPYDHVYLGDLLMRVGEQDDALSSYQEAVRSYESVGLNRNAIAVAKKILRIDPARPKFQRTLAELYDREGLKTEAVPHYLAFLDSFRGEVLPPEDFFETLERAAGISGLQVEVALRLADHFVRVRRGEHAAQLLEDVAQRAADSGSEDMVEELRRRAQDARSIGPEPLVPLPGEVTDAVGIAPTLSMSAPAASAAHMDDFDFGFEEPGASAAPSASAHAGGAHGGTPTAEPEPEVSLFDTLHPGPEEEEARLRAASVPPAFVEAKRAQSGEFALGDLGLAPSAPEPPPPALSEPSNYNYGEMVLERETPPTPAPPPTETPSLAAHFAAAPVLPDPGLMDAGTHTVELSASGEAADAESTLEARAQHAMAMRQWDDARGLYLQLHRAAPDDHEVMRRLIEVATQQGDRDGQILYLTSLGDALIQANELDEACDAFDRVLQLDPENVTAKRRMQRFHDLGMAPKSAPATADAHPPALSGVLDSGKALLDVKDQAADSDEWIDLAGLLEEFKAGLKNHMDAGDYQGHYDLALSHHQMGLLDDALEELELVLKAPNLPVVLEQGARELRGRCLMGLERNREAVHEFRVAVDKAEGDSDARRNALYHLGRALEAVEEWREAGESYEQLLSFAKDFLDAEARLQDCRNRSSSSSTQASPAP